MTIAYVSNRVENEPTLTSARVLAYADPHSCMQTYTCTQSIFQSESSLFSYVRFPMKETEVEQPALLLFCLFVYSGQPAMGLTQPRTQIPA